MATLYRFNPTPTARKSIMMDGKVHSTLATVTSEKVDPAPHRDMYAHAYN